MPVKPPCCGKCQEKRQSCRVDVACCLECHFAFEENNLFSYLPRAQQYRLRREHERLRSLGFPHDEVMRHSQREEQLFRTYVYPYRPDLVEQVEHDHDEYASGHLHSREAV